MQATPPAVIPATVDVQPQENNEPLPESAVAPTPTEKEPSEEVEIATEEAPTEVIPMENDTSVAAELTTEEPLVEVVPTGN